MRNRVANACPTTLQKPTTIAAIATIATLSGCDSARTIPEASATPVEITFSTAIPLDDGAARVLGRPSILSTGSRGEIVIGDRSDKDIKIYSPSGGRLRTVGSAGQGPGEFLSVMGAQAFGDSLAAYDFLLRRLTVFSSDGEAVRALTLDPPAFAMRVLDDSLFLLIRHAGQSGNLLRVIRRDGSVVADFFDARHTFRERALRHLTAVFADGADGRITVGVFGKDSLFAFDYRGRPVARGRIAASAEMETLSAAYNRARRRQRLSDGRWFHDGINALMSLVALPDGRAALLVAPYDTKVGTDVLEGGELIVVAPVGEQIIGVGRQQIRAGLLGRDRDGLAMFLRYRNADATGLDLVRASFR